MERNSWGVSLFADDVRFEAGGKISLLGIYMIDMVVFSEYPLLIPKLVISVRYCELFGAFNEDPILRVYLPGIGEPVFEEKISRPQPDAPTQPYPLTGDGEKIVLINLLLPFEGIQISEEGSIRVRMQCGDVVTPLGRLMVRAARPGEQMPSDTGH
jgi:hypothetical protein